MPKKKSKNSKQVRQFLDFLHLSGLDYVGNENNEEEYSELKSCFDSKNELKKFAFDFGDLKSDILIISDYFRESENSQKTPLLDEDFKLLTQMLKAIDIDINSTYITNFLKSIKKKTHTSKDIENHMTILDKQIDLVSPKLIIVLGEFTAENIFQDSKPFQDYREKVWFRNNIPMFVSYHPFSLRKDSSKKVPAWKDLMKIKEFYKSL